MKHYPHHIGDFDRATRHLTRLERSVYRDLLDLYYDTEKPLTLDMPALCRRILANSNEESTAVEQTLNEFFTKTPTGWFNCRCEAEIAAYRANNSQKAEAGRASAAAKRARLEQALNERSTDVQQPFNGRSTALQLTKNQEPRTNNQEPNSVTTDVVTAGDAGKSAALMTKDELWKAGKSLLSDAGMPASQCGSFVGKLVKDYGDAIVVDAVRSTVLARPADPAEYLKAVCMRAKGDRKTPNRQEAIEQRNSSVADQWTKGAAHEAV